MDLNPFNVFFICAAIVGSLALLMGTIVRAHNNDTEKSIVEQQTEVQRLAGCRSIEDEAVRALCLIGIEDD